MFQETKIDSLLKMVATLTQSVAAFQAGHIPNFSPRQPAHDPARDEPACKGSTDHVGRCGISNPPCGPDLNSIKGAWNEYKYGTATKPSIRRLINDHGNDWQHAKYGYKRQIWAEKRRVIAAIEGLKTALGVTADNAMQLLKEHMTSINVKVPVFCIDTRVGLPARPTDSNVDISSKCKDAGVWKSLRSGDAYCEEYTAYLRILKPCLGINVSDSGMM
ncbi:TPA: hypothetical protein ACH3X3_012861 [Trebouxia sp. C0006]